MPDDTFTIFDNLFWGKSSRLARWVVHCTHELLDGFPAKVAFPIVLAQAVGLIDEEDTLPRLLDDFLGLRPRLPNLSLTDLR